MAFNSETAKEARAKQGPRGESRLKKLFKEYADDELVGDLFNKLKSMALGGDMDAIKTLLSYTIGKPRETIDMTLDASVHDKRKPTWFREESSEIRQPPITIINTEVRSELQ